MRRFSIFILLLAGIFSIIYLISTGENFIKNRALLRKELASDVRVEVLNGASVEGLAEWTTESLRSKGFDVVGYGNASHKVPRTVIIDRADKSLKNAKLVRSALRQGKISFEPHPLQLLEVTVVLGEDFKVKKKASIINHK